MILLKGRAYRSFKAHFLYAFLSKSPVLVTPSNSDCDNSYDGKYRRESFDAQDTIHSRPQESSSDGKYRRESFDVQDTIYSSRPQENSGDHGVYRREILDVQDTILSRPQENYQPLSYHPPPVVPQLQGMSPVPLRQPYYASPVVSPRAAHVLRPSPEMLDEAIEELFLNDIQHEVKDSVLDFVNFWDPDACGGGDVALTNDTQLGHFLDKLLED
jgi:hypothetical protein